MKQTAYVAGVGMTPFGKHADTSLKQLAGVAILEALSDAGIAPADLEAAYMSSGAHAVITAQTLIPGEAVLRGLGIGRIPVVNVENACASGGTAIHQAAAMVTAGLHDVVLVCGYEKLVHPDKLKTFSVFTGAVDTEDLPGLVATIDRKMREAGHEPDMSGASKERSLFMDIYAAAALQHMRTYGTTAADFAAVVAKNSRYGSHNPRAQFRREVSIDDVLADRTIAGPLTLPMCSPVGDGAAAVVLVSARKACELGLRDPVRIAASVLATGWDYAPGETRGVIETAAAQAYEDAGIGPADLDVVELHDASAPSEIVHNEALGLCRPGEGARLVRDAHSRVAVNTSGGLLRKGHPIGATGVAQIIELTEQLRGRSGARQAEGARVGLAENGGGFIGEDVAAVTITLLTK